VGTFTSPSETFRRLVARPTWWLPFVIVVVASAMSLLVLLPKLDFEGSAREALEKQAEKTGASVTPAQIARVAPFLRIMTLATWPVSVLAAFFLVGLVLWGAARMLGAEASYAQILAIWGHSNLVNVVGVLISIPVALSLADGSLSVQRIDRLVRSNAGAFLDESAPEFLRALAGSLDVFSLVTLVLLILGFRRLPGLSKGAATAAPIVVWGIWVVAKVGMAAMRG